jgi:hypothetical protein
MILGFVVDVPASGKDELRLRPPSGRSRVRISLQEKCLTVYQAADRLSVTPSGLPRRRPSEAQARPRPQADSPRVRCTKGGFIFFPPKT